MVEAVDTKEYFLFDPAQFHVAVLVDDVLQGPPLGELDENVRIDKILRYHFREDDAHGAFAGAGHADEDNV